MVEKSLCQRFPWAVWLLGIVVPIVLAVLLLQHGYRKFLDREIAGGCRDLLETAQTLTTRSSPALFLSLRASGQSLYTWPDDQLLLQPEQTSQHPLFRAIMDYRPHLRSFDPVLLDQCRAVLGWSFDLDEFRSWPDCPHPITWEGKPAWILWREGPGAYTGGIYLFGLPPLATRLKMLLGDFLDRSKSPFDACLYVDGQAIYKSAAHDPDDVQTIAPFLEGRSKGLFRGDRVELLYRIDNAHHLYLHRRLPPWTKLSNLSRLWWLPLPFLLATFPFCLFGLRQLGRVSLRTKVIGLLAYILLLPLGGAVLATLGFIADRQLALESSILNEARRELETFDHGFLGEEQRSLRLFRQLARNTNASSTEMRAPFANLLKKKMSEDEFIWNQIRHPSGTFHTFSLLPEHSGTADFLWRMSDAIRQNFPQPAANPMKMNSVATAPLLPLESASDAAALGTANSVPANSVPVNSLTLAADLNNPALTSVESLLQQPDTIVPLNIGKNRHSFWWLPQVFSDHDDAKTIQLFFRTQRQAVASYLRRSLLSPREHRIMVFNSETRQWVGPFFVNEALSDLAEGANLFSTPLERSITVGGQKMLATCIKGRNMNNHVLIALCHPPDINTAIPFGQLSDAVVLMGLAVFIVGCIYLLLRSDLLSPLNELKSGIEALRERRGEHRIMLRNTDELGNLAAAFNHMLETVGELSLIGQIQDSFLPTIPPGLEEYDVQFQTYRRGNIGADYIDMFPLQNGNIAFFLATTPGRGFTAALHVAMTKAVIGMMAREGSSVSDILAELQELIDVQCNRGEMMPCIVLLLQPSSGRFEVYQAGQGLIRWTYERKPLLDSVKAAGRPISAQGQLTVQHWQDVMVPGQSLILFTVPHTWAVQAIQSVNAWAGSCFLMNKILQPMIKEDTDSGRALPDRTVLVCGRKRLAMKEGTSA